MSIDKSPMVGDFGLRLTFVQVKPGEESVVNERLKKSCPTARRYKCLGRFDYLLLNPLAGIKETDQLDGALLDLSDKIKQVNHALCYALDNPKSTSLGQSCFETEPFMVVSFLKFQHCLALDFGFDLVRRVNAYLGSGKQQTAETTTSLYGCLGWNELLMLSWGTNMASLIDEVVRVSDITAQDLGLRADDNLFVDTLSIPTLHFSCVEALLKRENVSRWRIKEDNRIRVSLHVSCKAGVAQQRMVAKIQQFLKCTPVVLYGKDDIVASPDLGLVDFLKGLLRMRENDEVKSDIFATSTSVSVSGVDFGNATGEIRPGELEVVTICKAVTDYREKNPVLYKSMVDIFCSMNSYFGDAVLCDAFLDMIPFLTYIASHYSEEEIRSTANLWDTINRFSKGFKQRLIGSHVTIFNVSELVLAYQAGLQRVLYAADLVPTMLTRNSQQEWNGFSIFGLKDQYMSYFYGIINLPLDCLFKPGMWFGVFHEVGHDMARKTKIIARSQEMLDRAVKFFASEEGDLSRASFPLGRRTAQETYSDLFDFICGFHCDWDLYLTKVVQYVFKYAENADQVLAYFRRTFMVFCYSRLGCQGAFGGESQRKFLSVREALIKELYATICRMVPQIGKVQELDTEFIHDVYLHQRQWREFAESATSEIERTVVAPPSHWKQECYSAIRDFRKGVVRDDLTDPSGLVACMPTDDDLRLNMTAIVSLSFCYVKNYAPRKLPVFRLV